MTFPLLFDLREIKGKMLNIQGPWSKGAWCLYSTYVSSGQYVPILGY